MRGGAKVVVDKHRHEGVFIAQGKEDLLLQEILFQVKLSMEKKELPLRHLKEKLNTEFGILLDQRLPLQLLVVSKTFGSNQDAKYSTLVLHQELQYLTYLTSLDQLEPFMQLNSLIDLEEI